MIEIAIFQVGSKYAWVLRERFTDSPNSPIKCELKEGVCRTFREASVEAETALLLHAKRD